jgi:hypothetical protein
MTERGSLAREAKSMIKEELAKSIADNLFSEEGMNVFAVLDGASIPDLLQVLHQHQPESVCLYRGELKPDLASVAPYLVHLQPGTPFADWLIGSGWGEHWGVFALAEASLVAMRKHFRKFLTVHNTEGKPLLFRYYDPRVLRVYLPTCNTAELQTIFGPLNSYLLEGEEPNTLLRFKVVKDALQQENKSLATAQA